MKRIILLLSFLIFSSELSFADSKPFVGNFKGMYGGVSAACGRTRITVNNGGFRGFFPLIGGVVGGGYVIDTAYFGVEAEVDYMKFSSKRGSAQLEKHPGIGGAFRIGKVLQNNFLSYLSLGISRSRYDYKSPTLKTSFDALSFSPEVGVDAFVTPTFMIRSSFRYEKGVHTSHKVPALQIGKKPVTSMIKIGFFYKI